MTTIEIILSIAFPVALLGWLVSYCSCRVWRTFAEWAAEALTGELDSNRRGRVDHGVSHDCIRRAGAKHGSKDGRIRTLRDAQQDERDRAV